MTILNALTALTHAASQMLYKWLPPPATPECTAFASHPLPYFRDNFCQTSDLAAWTKDDWGELLALARDQDLLPWLPILDRQSEKVLLLVELLMRHLKLVRQHGAHYITYYEDLYPLLLRSLADPPLALTVQGSVALLQQPGVSIVGSRKASAFALHQSFVTGKQLAAQGYAIISGGALGCDIVAHQGVLATKLLPAPALCVFAGGLESLYPRANEWVFRQLRQMLAVFISERFWWASCRPFDFPIRNRIISGLAQLTIVMQAHERSGALVTARLALDQGRDVAVLRHPSLDARALGSAALIADGALPLAPDHLVEDLLAHMGADAGISQVQPPRAQEMIRLD